jgi:hypothetical protein
MNDSRISQFIPLANSVIASTIANARVAAGFLPKYQLARTAKQVTVDRVNPAAGTVDDVGTIPLAEIWTRFAADWQQLAEPNFERALTLVRDAARAYCRLEDRLLFLGQSRDVAGNLILNGVGVLPFGARVDRGSVNDGLRGAGFQAGARNRVYEDVAAAYGILQEECAGPFAIAMGPGLADLSDQTPVGFLESPRRRIENLLGSIVRRAPVLPPWDAILIGGAGPNRVPESASQSSLPSTGPVDRAVAVDPELRDLGETDAQGRHVFWVVGNLALRLKDARGVIRVDFA